MDTTSEDQERSNPVAAPAGLLSLPVGIQSLIVDRLSVTLAKALALTSRKLYRPARYRILKDLDINLKVADLDPTITWLQNLAGWDWMPTVRTVTVLDSEYDYYKGRFKGTILPAAELELDYQRRVAHVCRAIEAMSGLHVLEWHGNRIPVAILARLTELPRVKLSAHIQSHRQRQLRPMSSSEKSPLHLLRNNTNLYSLNVQVTYTKADDCIHFMAELKRVLLTCPNLRQLRLDVGLPRDAGCVIYEEPLQYHGLGFIGDERLPSLEELDLSCYPFGAPPTSWQGTSTLGYPLDIDEREFWAERFDWSRIERLNVFCPHLAEDIAPRLTSVREVTLGAFQNHPFLLEVANSLDSINVQLDSRVGIHGILRHGETLRRLVMHCEERSTKAWHLQCLETSQLQQIGSSCPLLEELEIDVSRMKRDWPCADLNTLASFPRLTKLTLWFPLSLSAIADEHVPEKPLVTFSAAAVLFEYLRSQGSAIENLIIHSGAPPPSPKGLVDIEAYWPSENAATFRCALAERDWDAWEGLHATKCLDVGSAANEWMRLQLQAGQPSDGHDGTRLTEFGEAMGLSKGEQRMLRVAWEGPMTVEKWKDETEALT